MRTHPSIRTAIVGLAIVVAFIPGSIMLSELLESDELDKAETRAEREHAGEDARAPHRGDARGARRPPGLGDGLTARRQEPGSGLASSMLA
jgi:hypothetical protein